MDPISSGIVEGPLICSCAIFSSVFMEMVEFLRIGCFYGQRHGITMLRAGRV